MKLLKDQVIAGTGPDRHGDSLTEQELRRIFAAMEDPYLVCSEHDPGLKPIGKSFNKRIVCNEAGNLVIICDIEVYDDEKMDQYGGYSISFIRSTFSTNEHRTPEIHLLYNPRLFPTDEIMGLVGCSSEEIQLDASKLYQKSLDIPVMIYLKLAGGAILAGIFAAMGQDIYGQLRRFVLLAGERLRQEHGQELRCLFTFIASERDNSPEIRVTVSTPVLERLAAVGVTEQMIFDEIQQYCDVGNVSRASLTILNETPTWQVEYILDVDGRLID